ncbi:hypothetical protein IscW_ISCW010153 [Ixodes scapularis]|uniref:Uncharacterized protein n=1 Tax=Ixodes scapularis TaxID=6945 RepID=B7Q0L4_IXOSC|nr:hypothetical protein IscW_ISCW010153 [Ixodes scapularis]|eukprot:XP_002407972.1 hypothetical protein IscW_ISCW010153 [Ixodes scapularis]
MALSALDKAYSDEIRAIDKRIEETLQEIDTFLKNGSQETLPKHRAVSSDSETQIRRDHTRIVRVSLQKILQFCHDEPDSIEAVFQLLRSLAASASLVPFQAPVDCALCIRRLKERDRNVSRRASNPQASDHTKTRDTTTTATGISRNTHYSLEPDNEVRSAHSRENGTNVTHAPGLNLETEPIEDVKVLWRCVCYHVAEYVVQTLTTSSLFLSLTNSLIKKSKWEGYFEVLRVAFTPAQIRRIHQSVRTEQLRRFECACDDVACLGCLSNFCIRGLVEDVSFLCVGEFCPVVITWRELQGPYVTRIRDHVTLLLRELASSSHQVSKSGAASGGLSRASNKALTQDLSNVPKSLCCLANPNICFSNNEDMEKHAKPAEGRPATFENTSPKAKIATRRQESRKHGSLPTLVKQLSGSRGVEDAGDTGDWLSVVTIGLVEELHWFERQLNCVYNFDSCMGGGDAPCGYPFAMASNSPEESPVHDSDNDDDETNACFWDWRGLLASNGLLTLLQRSIQDDILLERKALPKSGWESTELADVCGSCVKVTASASQAVAHLDRYSRVASASRAGLSPFRASFSHAVHVRIDEALADVEAVVAEKHNVPDALAVALNTALYLAEAVGRFSTALAGGGKSKEADKEGTSGELHGVQQRANKAASLAEMQISLHHLKWLSGCVAQDAGSHDWAGRGVFHEASLRSDLSRDVPWDRARSLLAEVLAKTLQQESFRYAGIRPSEQRLPQLVADIGTLLLCAYDALFAVSTTPGEVLGHRRHHSVDFQDRADEAFYVEAIHSHCTVLLATLCVATAPLEAVYRDFKCGYPEPSPNADLVAFSPWLAWARPGLFQWHPWARPLPSVAVWVPVAMCLASPRPDPQLVVRGSRPSFTVQAWNLYLQGLRSDLYRDVPWDRARSLLAEVLAKTLQQESFRYAGIKPSEQRLPQLVADIGTLLLCAYDALFAVSTTPGEVLGHRRHHSVDFQDRADESFTAENCTLSTMLTAEAATLSLSADGENLECFRRFVDAALVVLVHSDHLEHSVGDVLLTIVKKQVTVVASSASTILKLCCEDEQQWVRQAENEILQGSPVTSENVAGTERAVVKVGKWGKDLGQVRPINLFAIESVDRVVADRATGTACLTELLSCAMAVVPTFPTPLLTCLTLLDLIVHRAGVRSTNNSAGLQETLLRFPLRPDRVLSHLADFGVTETNFRLLLFNRWEFQPDASVPPDLEKAVKVLHTLYSPRTS